MASIYKRPDSDIYQCQYYVKSPKTGELSKIRKSTGTTNKKKAQALADQWEAAAQQVIQAGTDRAQQAKEIFAEVVREIDRQRLTAQAVRKYLAKLLDLATGEELDNYTVASWTDEWLRRKGRDSSPSTIKHYRAYVLSFLEFLGPERVKRPLESVTVQDVRLWREGLQNEGRAGRTVAGYVKTVSALYTVAVREGITTINPAKALEAIQTNDSQQRRPFTDSEVADLLAAAPSPEWRGLILVGAFTGLRLGDAAGLSWKSVDLAAKKITVTPSKTKRKQRQVAVPIHPDLLAYLEGVTITDDSPSAAVFPSLSEMLVGARAGLSAAFVKIMHAAGVDRGEASREAVEGQERGAGRITYQRGFHSLRHTFTTWLRAAGVSEEDRMALTGHSTRESHQIYSHPGEEAAKSAIAKLPTLKNSES